MSSILGLSKSYTTGTTATVHKKTDTIRKCYQLAMSTYKIKDKFTMRFVLRSNSRVPHRRLAKTICMYYSKVYACQWDTELRSCGTAPSICKTCSRSLKLMHNKARMDNYGMGSVSFTDE